MDKPQKKLLTIIISFFFLSLTTHAQILSKQDSISFKKDLEKLLTKYGLQTAGYQINVQSDNQRGGQTAFTITNNNYVTNNYGIIVRKLSDIDKVNLVNRIDTILKSNNLPKGTLIELHISMGNDENLTYANEIGNFLFNNGYKVSNNLGIVLSTGKFRLFLYDGKIFVDVGLASVNAGPSM